MTIDSALKNEVLGLDFKTRLSSQGLRLHREKITTLQVNLGKLCNQACRHCHVDAGPTKTEENMGLETVSRLRFLIDRSPDLKTLDITGGAPELNPHFRDLVRFGRLKNMEIIDRCNLTVLFQKGQEDTPEFLAKHSVHVVASLPCYSRENVDRQRGSGVFNKSILALKKLNALGYGRDECSLQLSLVYNPLGPSLPPEQNALEQRYKTELREDFGIEFNNLFTITNMPIKRFLDDLQKSDRLEEYMTLLANSFNARALENVMCRSMLSVSWDGYLYDCDFNQMLGMKLDHGLPNSISDLESFHQLNFSSIVTENHCYGCTAGSGSSCTGALGTLRKE